MSATEARAVLKAINRHLRKAGWGQGGRQWGVDYATWRVLQPQMSDKVNECARVLTGREGRFIPRGAL